MPFKSEKQRRWMHLHHPEVAGDWEKKYKDGGFVEDSKEANKAGDVVNAKLAIGELILNGKHLEKVEEMTGVPAEKFWAEVGVPGFEGRQNPMEAKGGGVATKKDHLMKYQDGGVPIQQSLNVPSQEYEGIIPPERRKTQYATPRAGVEGYYDMGRINYTPSDTEKVSGIKGLLQRVLPGGKTGREGRKMTNEEKIEVYRASRYGDDLPESNPYYNMMNSPLETGNAPNRRYSSEGYQKGGVTKKKKKKKKRGY
jgi:hypothetical protein